MSGQRGGGDNAHDGRRRMPWRRCGPSAGKRFTPRYNRMTRKASSTVIGTYSTSFSLATRLLGARERQDVRNLYAMVRIADEIVDGTAEEAGCTPAQVRELLDHYEELVLRAPAMPFHPDPVLHAYAGTVRRCGIEEEHVRAFFRSMRRDLTESTYDHDALDEYVYGSAEVIGLMCLSIFLADHPATDADRATMTSGARSLGAAFQKINFLRDLAEDTGELGRTYFDELDGHALTERIKADLLDDIDADLADARTAIPLLPGAARAGVLAAADLFAELSGRLLATPAELVATTRIRVPGPKKAAIAGRAAVAAARMGRG